MRIRLAFEPNLQVNCNEDKMFRCYGENYLSDFPQFEYSGFLVLDAKQSIYDRREPFYQFIAHDATDQLRSQIEAYITSNPMHGYHTHVLVE